MLFAALLSWTGRVLPLSGAVVCSLLSADPGFNLLHLHQHLILLLLHADEGYMMLLLYFVKPLLQSYTLYTDSPLDISRNFIDFFEIWDQVWHLIALFQGPGSFLGEEVVPGGQNECFFIPFDLRPAAVIAPLLPELPSPPPVSRLLSLSSYSPPHD